MSSLLQVLAYNTYNTWKLEEARLPCSGFVRTPNLGVTIWNKFNEFWKTPKRPLTPILFSENYVALFSVGTKICNKIFWIGVTPLPPFPENPSILPPQSYRKNCNEIC